MNSFAYLNSLALLAIGVYYLASDGGLIWSLHQSKLRMNGVTSVERTPEWDSARKLRGYGSIACAQIILLLILAASPSQISATRPANVGARNSDSGFTLNGTPISPEEMHAMGLSPSDKHR